MRVTWYFVLMSPAKTSQFVLQLQRDGFVIVKSLKGTELASAASSGQHKVFVLRPLSTIEHDMAMFCAVMGAVSATLETVLCPVGMRRAKRIIWARVHEETFLR